MLKPSEVLKYANLSPLDFGLAEEALVDPDGEYPVDQPGNVVYNTTQAAKLIFDEIVTDQGDTDRAELALTYFTLFRLFGTLADQRALEVGLVTQRGGQVSTPIGSYNELMSAGRRNYQEAKNLYPDAPWPLADGEATGGSFKIPRRYAP